MESEVNAMYLDPGFGSMLIQDVVAHVAAGGVLIFSLRKKLSGLFKKKHDKDAEAAKGADRIDRDRTDHVIDAIDEWDENKV
ncbi:MAG: hypothetical protein LBS25_06550 [Candidatus Symbiothrix sp.]|nr:hypothetical protein [Candidatus Symbiothrix sp.]